MFDIGWTELFVIGVLVLIVMGPRELPRVLYQIGKWVRRARAVTREFQGHLDAMVRDAELEDLRAQARAVRGFDVRGEIKKTVDPEGVFDRGLSDHLGIETTPAADRRSAPAAEGAPDPAAPVASPGSAPAPSGAGATPSSIGRPTEPGGTADGGR